MLARKLENCPADRDLPITAEIMTEDLVKARCVDPVVATDALEEIGRTDTRWPQPARVIEVIEARGHRRTWAGHQFTPALPRPERTPEQEARILEMIRQARNSCR